MTYEPHAFAQTRPNRPDPAHVIGPYSIWPRRPRHMTGKVLCAGSVGALAVAVHCVAPLLA